MSDETCYCGACDDCREAQARHDLAEIGRNSSAELAELRAEVSRLRSDRDEFVKAMGPHGPSYATIGRDVESLMPPLPGRDIGVVEWVAELVKDRGPRLQMDVDEWRTILEALNIAADEYTHDGEFYARCRALEERIEDALPDEEDDSDPGAARSDREET